MRVATVNCGSSSVKAGLFDVDLNHVELVGGASCVVAQGDGYGAAVDETLRELLDASSTRIEAVGHRIVFGGAFAQPAMIDDEVVREIEAGRRVAPVHNGLSLEGISRARNLLGTVPTVAVFDTAFHATLPAVAAHYALPRELTLKHRLRRYGYHGIAHRSLAERYWELTATASEDVSIITLQLGGGCSATAVAGGRSIDTSMGFTPLEGLIMGTRSGDVDPGALTYLLREGAVSPETLDDLLNHRSGLLGISGSSGDMVALLAKEAQGYPTAHDAIEMFCYRVRKYIGAYIAVLGRADAVVFGGGIGERSPEIRRRICAPLEPLGVRIDEERNAALAGAEGRISTDGSRIAVWAIPSDEERIIARDTYELLARMKSDGRDP